MPSSSKSLARILSNVYEDWENNLDWNLSPSTGVKEAFLAIDGYVKKHTNGRSTLNESLKAVHDNYIQCFEEISREIFFVEVLTRLVPVLNYEHVKLCVLAYLRPALHSVGYDLKFVEKARSLFMKITADSSDTQESQVPSRVESNSSLVMDSILKVLLENDSGMSNILGLEFDHNDEDLLHGEKIEYLQQNASMLLKEMALISPIEYFNLLDKHFQFPSKRQKACLLLCQILSEGSPQFKCITSTPLMKSLIRCLSFDFQISVISGALLALLLIIGKIIDRLPYYLPDLFYVFGRLATMQRFSKFVDHREAAMGQILTSLNVDWSIASYDGNSSSFSSLLMRDGSLDTLYLLSVLYGLFPLHVLEFAKLPIKFFRKSTPSIIPFQFVIQIEETFSLPIHTYVGERARSLLKRVLLHPNIINGLTSEEELTDPTRWILVQNNGRDMGDDEILSLCLQLNADMLLSLSEDSSWCKILSEPDSSSEFERTLLPIRKVRRLIVSSLLSARQSIGLGQSDAEKATQNSRSEISAPSGQKIPPSPFENSVNENGDINSSISFRKIDFAGGSSFGLEVDPQENLKRNSVSSLLSAHERIHSEKALSNLSNAINIDNNYVAVGSIELAPKGASDLLTKQLKNDAKNSKIFKENSATAYVHEEETVDKHSPRTIEFCHKQLLLLRNEIEFLKYINGMSKLSYAKLRRQTQYMMRPSASNDNECSIAVSAYNDLLRTMKDIEVERAEELSNKSQELKQLYTRIDDLQLALEELKQKCVDLEANLSLSQLLMLKIEMERAARDAELQELRLKGKVTKMESRGDPFDPNYTEFDRKDQVEQIHLDNESRRMIDMEIEVKRLREKNKRLSSELERSHDLLAYNTQSHEKRIESLKHDLGEKFRKSNERYEQKIHEVNLVLVRLETLLEEKNAHIMQLSTSRPIQIPSVLESQGDAHDQQYLRPGSKYTLDYFSHQPSAPPVSSAPKTPLPSSRQSSTQYFPIIKGRGGYQKRIKKIM